MQIKVNPVIEVKGVGKRVSDATGELRILDGIDFDVAAGESLAIVGESGSGKSTLLGLLAGLDSVSSGSIRLLGEDLGALNEDQRAALRSRGVGFVFQSFQLMPHLTALENVMLPLELRRAAPSAPPIAPTGGASDEAPHGPHAADDAEDVVARATRLLASVGLASRTRHYPRVLSGGEQQRVALARAFATRPAILFADEPTGSLDAVTGEAVIRLMFEMNRAQGATLVLVTHDLELARRCDRIIRIEAGRLRA